MPITRHAQFLRPLQTAVDRFLIPSVERGVLSAKPVHDWADANARALANVHSIGIGFKRINGQAVPQTLAVRFFVIQKLPGESLQPEFVIPNEIEGMPTDIVEAPTSSIDIMSFDRDSPCLTSSSTSVRPLLSGLALAPPNAFGSGTLAWFCRSRHIMDALDPGANYILSNWHVLTNYGTRPMLASIRQPPATPQSFEIARSHRVISPLPFPQPNFVDAGIAKLNPSLAFDLRVREIGQINSSPLTPAIGRRVRKFGPMSCNTTGIITDFPFLTAIQTTFGNETKKYLFSDQVRIVSDSATPFSRHGDSGSLILDEQHKRPVALLFGLESGGAATYASPIDAVCQDLEIELL